MSKPIQVMLDDEVYRAFKITLAREGEIMAVVIRGLIEDYIIRVSEKPESINLRKEND